MVAVVVVVDVAVVVVEAIVIAVVSSVTACKDAANTPPPPPRPGLRPVATIGGVGPRSEKSSPVTIRPLKSWKLVCSYVKSFWSWP